MSEQADNEMICAKLLRWERAGTGESWGMKKSLWRAAGNELHGTPTFTDWASAGLIADALANLGVEVDILYVPDEKHWESANVDLSIDESGDTGPLSLRAMALAYIRSMT